MALFCHTFLFYYTKLSLFKSTKKEGFEDMIDEGYKATIDIMPEILKLFNKKPLKAKHKVKYLNEDRVVL